MKATGVSFIGKIKKATVVYYAKNILRQAVPAVLYQKSLQKRLNEIDKYNAGAVWDRVNYYNKLSSLTPVEGNEVICLKDMQMFKSPKSYNFDTYEYTRYFDKSLKANFLFGDVTHVAALPSIQKSRPVAGNNANAILLNLDKRRHFVFVKDSLPFAAKKDLLIGRGVMTQPHRTRFMEMYFGHAFCNLGQVNKMGGNAEWLKPKIGIAEHLGYKFILSLEGNDVATNLKWIMSSNSVAVMPVPKYETWFMEGRLIPGYHYIAIKDDYTDLEEKLKYYLRHPGEAEIIARNANQYVKQFADKKQERLIALLVLQKYFKYTGQLSDNSLN
nr:glycosyl transferase family 90 [uncultured Mucilaginibacter sp.]